VGGTQTRTNTSPELLGLTGSNPVLGVMGRVGRLELARLDGR
jgi:hypothetical protein